jgi:hypothetical protein
MYKIINQLKGLAFNSEGKVAVSKKHVYKIYIIAAMKYTKKHWLFSLTPRGDVEIFNPLCILFKTYGRSTLGTANTPQEGHQNFQL